MQLLPGNYQRRGERGREICQIIANTGLVTALTTAIRTIDPSVTQTYPATAAKAPTRFFFVASLDSKENQAGDQISNNKHPTDRRNSQKVIEHTMTITKQPEIARHNRQDSYQAKDDEP